jgi:hypothetical protein
MRLEDFMAAPEAVAAALARAEVLALRLYTGPGYRAVNGSAREGGQAFPCTCFALEAAIIKLALSAGKIPSAVRGVSGDLRMPGRFAEEYRAGRTGACVVFERGFLSATRNLSVAASPAFSEERGAVILFWHRPPPV